MRKDIKITEEVIDRLLASFSFLTVAVIVGIIFSFALLDRSIAGIWGIIACVFGLIGISKARGALLSLMPEKSFEMADKEEEQFSEEEVPAPVVKRATKAQHVDTPKSAVINNTIIEDEETIDDNGPSWLETVNWEEWVGKKLLQKIGILIVLIGIIVLLKYSFDNKWIDELGRLGLAMISAVALLVAGELFRTKYAKWSDGFTGGGIIILYFVVWAAHVFYAPMLLSNYQLSVSPTMALVLYSVITAFSALVSIRYRSQIIAWFGLVGGYLTPALIETPTASAAGLTFYLAILTAGLLALSWHQRWKIIAPVCFVITQAYLFGAIYPALDINDPQQIVIAIGFFILFSLVPVLTQFHEKLKTRAEDVLLTALSGLAVFTPVVEALGGYQSEWTTVVCLGLATVYVALSALALTRRSDDDLLVNTYLVGSIGLIALAIFKQMGTTWFALGFAPYSLILALISARIRRFMPLACGFVIMAGALAGLFINLPIFQATEETIWRPFTSTWAIQSYVVLASLIGWSLATRTLPKTMREEIAPIKHVSSILIALIVFSAVTFETTQLHFAITSSLAFAYLGFTAVACLLFFFTGEIIWFVAAFIVQILVLLFTFLLGPSALSIAQFLGQPAPTTVVAVVHPWALVSLLSIGVLIGLFAVVKRSSSSVLQNTSVSQMMLALVLAQVWLHVTVEIQNLSVVYVWSHLLFHRVLSGWWILFALGLLPSSIRRPKLQLIAIGLLCLPLIKDCFLMTAGQSTLYETALWTVLPITLAILGDRTKMLFIVQGMFAILVVTAAMDAVTHIDGGSLSILRSLWWVGAIGVLAGTIGRRSTLYRQACILLLCIPLGRDLFLMVIHETSFYETALWTIVPLLMAVGGSRLKMSEGMKAGLIMLTLVAITDMATHIGQMDQGLLRSTWWALAGLTAMIGGFVEREGILRKYAIGLFCATTLKLLLIDFNVLSTPVRIGASIGTGLLMIGASYMYQRFSEQLEKK